MTQLPSEVLDAAADEQLLRQAWGALNFILAFYEPGQRYLDTEAWKQAEAGGHRAHAALSERLGNPHLSWGPNAALARSEGR
jgi:hypothetical protein